MRKSTKACDISQKVKEAVWQRDGYRCIVCGNPNATPSCHFIARSQLGLGVEQNIVTLCSKCHYNYDHTTRREEYRDYIRNYLASKYDDWSEEKLKYSKYDNY